MEAKECASPTPGRGVWEQDGRSHPCRLWPEQGLILNREVGRIAPSTEAADRGSLSEILSHGSKPLSSEAGGSAVHPSGPGALVNPGKSKCSLSVWGFFSLTG